MRLLIEFDGLVIDLAPVWYDVHKAVTVALGWSSLDQGTYWRLTRKQGRDADVLPGARSGKVEDYHRRFDEQVESDDVLARATLHEDVRDTIMALRKHADLVMITTGSNLAARQAVLDRNQLGPLFEQAVKLDPDPRRRPAEMRVLAGGDPRTIVAATTETVLRAAGASDLFALGVSSGACLPARLHQAGAAVVFRDLSDLTDTLATGAPDLVRAGLLPAPLG